MRNFLHNKLYLLFFLIYFIPAFFTISDYNMNWDEAEHFRRGQAILRYFLTGQTNYKNLPSFQKFQETLQAQNKLPKNFSPHYSRFQNAMLDGDYYLQRDDGGHPPLSDILAAVSNYVLFQKLGFLGDVESYHFIIVAGAAFLVFLISFWIYKEYGFFASLVSTLSLTLTPLFFAESHVNIKDPLETTFFALTIYTFYQGIIKEKRLLVLLSSLFFGMAFATKFNALFLPCILIPWLIIYYGKNISRLKRFFFTFIPYPFIVFSIFFFSWPFLWFDFPKRVLAIFGYYRTMGISNVYTQPPSFYLMGFNTYPLQTILFTTPLVILLFSIFGIIYVFAKGFKEKNKTSFLILFWFLIPIIRVTLPNTSIYGGVRQIMEYIPAMAILSGIGADYLVRIIHRFFVKTSLSSQIQNSKLKMQNYNSKFKILNYGLSFALCTLNFELRKKVLNKKTLQLLVILSFLPITLKLISIHPNENVYFNPLIGGLKGAVEKDYPYWGFNLGSSYKQGVDWLNENAEKNASVALVLGIGSNIPKNLFREDIAFDNGSWSSTQRKGEYLIEAVYKDWIREWYYDGEYVDKVLKPVYEVKVDSIPILKIWKNDKEHTDPRFLEEKFMLPEKIKWEKSNEFLIVAMEDTVDLTKVSISYEANNCSPFKSGSVFLSNDGVTTWTLEREPIRGGMLKENQFIYPLVGKRAKYFRIKLDSKNACDYSVKDIKINYIQ